MSSESLAKSVPVVKDTLTTSKHSVRIAGKEIRYTATTGTLVLKHEQEKKGEKAGEFEGQVAKAEVFFVAYTKDGVRNKRKRPLSFTFNGGPGSSSVWLHLGALGPRRVASMEAEPNPPPYSLLDNAYSLLDVSDLVFIDPVSTGYSRPVAGEKAKDFHSLKSDIESVGQFIRLYLSKYDRWQSPKFLIGESYGTTRAAGLAGHLQERYGMYLNGLMLISCVLDFTTLLFKPNNDIPYSLYLPTYAATAWYHNKLSEKLQKKTLKSLLKEVEAFTLDTYAPALFKGSRLAKKDYKEIAKTLAYYTGLSQDYIERCHLRIDIMRFVKELLRNEGRTLGRLDSRFTGIDRDSAGESFEYDPSLAAISGIYTAGFNAYIKQELAYESDLPYEILSLDVNEAWQWGTGNSYVDVAEVLRKAMSMNPHLKVHVANAYYDLATPHFATEYTFNHLALDESLQDNISMSYYEAGHMMYVHEASLKKLKRELAAFIKG